MVGNYTAGTPTGEAMIDKQPVPFWWFSAFVYVSFDIYGGSKYYTSLGATVPSKKDACLGGVVGSIALLLVITLLSTAMLTNIEQCSVLDVPNLYLSRLISFYLGAVFSIILMMGIFSASSAMLWTIAEKMITEGLMRRGTRKSYLLAAMATAVAFALGLLLFSNLLSIVFTISGYLGFIFIACVIYKRLRSWRNSADLRS